MTTAENGELISVEDYLVDELARDIKHQFVDGAIYAMTDASANHARISGNIAAEFGNHLEVSPCESFSSDMKVKIGSRFFYPDVLVDCCFDESQPYYNLSSG